MNKKDLKRTEEWLDERYSFIKYNEKDEPIVNGDEIFYRGAIEAIVFLGLSWTRNKNGKHLLFK